MKNLFKLISILFIALFLQSCGATKTTKFTTALNDSTDGVNLYNPVRWSYDTPRRRSSEINDYLIVQRESDYEYFVMDTNISPISEDNLIPVVYYPNVFRNYFETSDGNKFFEENSGISKDLEKIASHIESSHVQRLTQELSERFGLSEDRAYKIAKLKMAYKTISSKRLLTARDRDRLTHELVGVNHKTAMSALKKHIQGDSSEMDSILDLAAEKNGVDPEHMNEILNEVLAG